MCGIIGIVGKFMPEKNFIDARDKLKHRGPDDAGLYLNKEDRIMFGHRRLSIIDLSALGHQPFISNDERYVLIFNGEIYNYLEIKKELKDFYDFKTNTDTEVLLASYMKWGRECLLRFNGMFAFAVWDKKSKELFCARDRLGIKPFYYTDDNNSLLFASEIKALLALGCEKKINEKAVHDYLVQGYYDHTEDTFFKNIKQFKAGTYGIWKNGKLTKKEYWNLANAQLERGVDCNNEEEVVEKFNNLLADAIKLRFRSDVPVGLCLSSGLDSNSLLYYSKKIIKSEVDIISMCSPSQEYNECLLIDRTLDYSQKQRWSKVYLEHDLILKQAERMNMIQDQPFGGVPTLGFGKIMEKALEKNVTVLLHGQGVDELLGGYEYYQNEYKIDCGEISSSEQGKKNMSQDMSSQIYLEILDKNFVKNYKNINEFKKPFDSFLMNAQYRDIVYTKIPRTLRFTDHGSMAFSRELRVPYLDHRLVEFCFHLPMKYKMNNQSQKVLIRSAMKNILPDIVQQKKKRAFGLIQVELFRKYYKKQIYSILKSDSFRELKYWNYDILLNRVDDFYRGKYDNSFFIWQCINLNLFLKNINS